MCGVVSICVLVLVLNWLWNRYVDIRQFENIAEVLC